MKKFISILSVAFLATVFFTACGGNGPTTDEGVLINGVKWATRNVGSAGTFVKSPQDFGNYYTWEQAQTACPSGWRLPTKLEFESLISAGSALGKLNGKEGNKFGDANKNIFLPSAGWCWFNDNTFYVVGSVGYYYSSTEIENDSELTYTLCFSQNTEFAEFSKAYGFPVRCVKE